MEIDEAHAEGSSVVQADAQAHLLDRELVVAVRSGDANSFAILVDRYDAPLRRYLARCTGDRGLADDLAQEAFLNAYRRLDRFAGDYPFAAWLYAIARNQLRMAARRQRLRRFVSLEWLPESVATAIPALHVTGEAERCHERDIVQRVLDELSPTLREALLLHSLEGFTAPEVARILGTSLPATERRISRAKQAFRRSYEHQIGQDRSDRE